MRNIFVLAVMATGVALGIAGCTHSATTGGNGTMVGSSSLPAFPGAEGYGALATGGRGGEIIHVTTLADAGEGSFREAVSKPSRMVVFDVSGLITLLSNVEVCDNVTIAGQTAPGQGICIYNRSTSLSGHKNIIIRYMRFREGIHGDSGKCAINMAAVSNVILDHCSIEWGRWDSMGLTKGSHDVSVQNCIIGASIDPQRFGAIVDSVQNVTLAHNLWIHNQSRNPKVKGTIQYINNVVYDWGITGLAGGHSATDHQVDVINNYLIKGPASNDQAAGGFTVTDHVYSRGNLVDLNRDGVLNGSRLTEANYADKKGGPTFVTRPWAKPPVAVTTYTATEAYRRVMAEAGCSLKRDAVDERLIADVASLGKAGHISHNETEAGGLGDIPMLHVAEPSADGIPNEWKVAHGMDPRDGGQRLDSSGYRIVEVYANGLVK